MYTPVGGAAEDYLRRWVVGFDGVVGVFQKLYVVGDAVPVIGGRGASTHGSISGRRGFIDKLPVARAIFLVAEFVIMDIGLVLVNHVRQPARVLGVTGI